MRMFDKAVMVFTCPRMALVSSWIKSCIPSSHLVSSVWMKPESRVSIGFMSVGQKSLTIGGKCFKTGEIFVWKSVNVGWDTLMRTVANSAP